MALEIDEVRERLDELVESWERDDGQVEFATREHYMLGPIAFGLASHCHQLARGLRALDEGNAQQAAMPLVRQMVECAMTVIWLERFGERAGRALMREHAQNRDKTLTEFVRTGGDVDAETRVQADEYLEELEDEARAEGRNFRERCEDIEGGLRMYAFWRIAAGESHASTAIADHYLHEVADAPAGMMLSTTPKPGAWEAWLGTSLTMLVLASLAADRFEKGHPRRTRLKQIAREVGTVVKWQATATGLKRQRKWELQRRAQMPRRQGQASSERSNGPRDRRR